MICSLLQYELQFKNTKTELKNFITSFVVSGSCWNGALGFCVIIIRVSSFQSIEPRGGRIRQFLVHSLACLFSWWEHNHGPSASGTSGTRNIYVHPTVHCRQLVSISYPPDHHQVLHLNINIPTHPFCYQYSSLPHLQFLKYEFEFVC
jgi:hypothetical protein